VSRRTVCAHAASAGAVFEFPVEGGMIVRCWRCAIRHRPVLGRSARIAVVVGTVLALINHGDRLLGGPVTGAIALKIAITYTVPFAVARGARW